MEERMREVWIVDDDDEMSHAVKLMLQLLDSTVEIFRDARSAAKRLLAGDRPELIVLDINMPEVSGIDFLEFLRMRDDFKKIPVVMLSSETTDIQVDEAMRIGANAFVFKPVTLEELEEAIRIALPKS
jgi:two-component system, chemotaxis family, chemotaxis protein CheY